MCCSTAFLNCFDKLKWQQSISSKFNQKTKTHLPNLDVHYI